MSSKTSQSEWALSHSSMMTPMHSPLMKPVPCNHLILPSSIGLAKKGGGSGASVSTTDSIGSCDSLASGAHPTTTFPCDHLNSKLSFFRETGPRGGIRRCSDTWMSRVAGLEQVSGAAKWAPPKDVAPLEQLREAIAAADWPSIFAEGKSRSHVESSWSANKERCEMLKCFCETAQVRRVLEVGSFCGVASLAMAESLPEDGQVTSLEVDPFLVEFGKDIIGKSVAKRKITNIVGPAMDSLKKLASQVKEGPLAPYELVIIDADKANMLSYFRLLQNTPGMLAPSATVCIDITPFKGLPPDRYVRFGMAGQWSSPSGRDMIDALRVKLAENEDYMVFEMQGFLVVRKRA